MQTSPTINNLVEALVEAKKGFKPIVKNKIHSHYKYPYADLCGILEAIDDSLLNQGLFLTHMVDGALCLTRIIHKSGEFMEVKTPILVARSDGKNDASSWGTALTYARRYGLCALLAITADEDTDGDPDMHLPRKPSTKKTYVDEEEPFIHQGLYPDQADYLENLLKDHGDLKQNMLDFYGVSKIADIPFSKYKEVLSSEALKKLASQPSSPKLNKK